MSQPARKRLGSLLCQVCGAANAAESSCCARCGKPLLVVSGSQDLSEDPLLGQGDRGLEISLDEHLLERVSALEEALRRATDSVRRLASALELQDRQILALEAGLLTLRELLDQQGVLTTEDWFLRWRSRLESRLRALSRRDRFLGSKERILAHREAGSEKLLQRYLDEAEGAFQSGDLERADRCLEQAYRIDPENLELQILKGHEALEAGDFAAAREILERAVARGAQARPEVCVALGLVLQEQGESEKARGLLEQAVHLDPGSALCHLALGAWGAARGELPEAREHLERAVELERSPQGLFLLGRIHRALGDLGRAVSALEEAVRLAPEFEEAQYELGLAYLDRKWPQRALAAFREAARLNPRRLRYQDLVHFLAPGAAQPIPSGSAESQAALAEAEKALAAGHGRRALRHLAAGLESEPKNLALLLRYAVVASELGEHDRVESAVVRLLALGGHERVRAAATALRIQSLRLARRFEEANDLAERLVREATSPVVEAIGSYELALNFAESESDLERALHWAARARDIAPEELKPYALAALGWVEFKRGALETARTHLEWAFEMAPVPAIAAQLGTVLLADGQESRARQLLEQAGSSAAAQGGLEQRAIEDLWEFARLLERAKRRRVRT